MRLLAEESSPLSSELDALRARGPDVTQLASLASGLSLRGIEVTAHTPPVRPKSWKKWAVAGGGGGVAAALLWLALGAPERHVEATDTAERARALETAQSEKQRKATAAMPTAAASPRAEEQLPGVADANVTLESPSAAAPAAAAEATPATVADARPPSEPSVTAISPRAEARPASPIAKPSAGATTAPSPGELGAPTELELLRDARLALKQSPSRALALTEQHAQLYPGGKLSQERELIAISALVALGRRTAALSRGARFEQSFPTSPYRKQVGDLLNP